LENFKGKNDRNDSLLNVRDKKLHDDEYSNDKLKLANIHNESDQKEIELLKEEQEKLKEELSKSQEKIMNRDKKLQSEEEQMCLLRKMISDAKDENEDC
jgi:hypothetical protein